MNLPGLATHLADAHGHAVCGTPAPPARRTDVRARVNCRKCLKKIARYLDARRGVR